MYAHNFISKELQNKVLWLFYKNIDKITCFILDIYTVLSGLLVYAS